MAPEWLPDDSQMAPRCLSANSPHLTQLKPASSAQPAQLSHLSSASSAQNCTPKWYWSWNDPKSSQRSFFEGFCHCLLGCSQNLDLEGQPAQLSYLISATSAQPGHLSQLSSAISAKPPQLSHLSSASSAQPVQLSKLSSASAAQNCTPKWDRSWIDPKSSQRSFFEGFCRCLLGCSQNLELEGQPSQLS